MPSRGRGAVLFPITYSNERFALGSEEISLRSKETTSLTIIKRKSSRLSREFYIASSNSCLSLSFSSLGVIKLDNELYPISALLLLSNVRLSRWCKYLKQQVLESLSSLYRNCFIRSRLAGVVIMVKICPSFGSSIRQFSALCYSSSLNSGPRRSIIEKTVQERISYADVSVKVGYCGV